MEIEGVDSERHREDGELHRRVIDGLAAQVEAFGSGAPDSRVIRRDGIVAAVAPSVPERSVFNSVCYRDASALRGMLDELAATYAEAGVRAWTVWVSEADRDAASLLASRGHLLDAAPRAMALWLDDLAPVDPAPAGISALRGDPATAAALNDRAYGYDAPAFRAALSGETDPPLRWTLATREGEPLACVATLEVGDDCCITGVATAPEHQRRGIAGWLLHRALVEARGRGLSSATLQATKAGAGTYRRLGFRDLGCIEMWERRMRHGPRGGHARASGAGSR